MDDFLTTRMPVHVSVHGLEQLALQGRPTPVDGDELAAVRALLDGERDDPGR